MRLRPASGRLLLFGLPPWRLSGNPPEQQLPQRELQEDLGLLLRRPLLPVHRMHLGSNCKSGHFRCSEVWNTHRTC